MKTFNIKDTIGGWFVGNFEPSIVQSAYFEVGHHSFKKGDIAPPHIHKVAWELNYIIKGRIKAGRLNKGGERELGVGDMFMYMPYEIADGEALEDTEVIVVKCPSVPDDKYIWDVERNCICE